MQVGVGIGRPPAALTFVLVREPLPQPLACVHVHGTIRAAHRAQAEVVGPAPEHPVHEADLLCRVPELPARAGFLADRPADPLDTLLTWPRAQLHPPMLVR